MNCQCTNVSHTHRIGGVNRLIRIIHRDGLYGFADPLEFTSVVDLVNYHMSHNLKNYSSKLDTVLRHPVSREELKVCHVGLKC